MPQTLPFKILDRLSHNQHKFNTILPRATRANRLPVTLILFAKNDGLVKSGSVTVYVIPAQAGIQSFQVLLDSRLRGSEGSGTFYEFIKDDEPKVAPGVSR